MSILNYNVPKTTQQNILNFRELDECYEKHLRSQLHCHDRSPQAGAKIQRDHSGDTDRQYRLESPRYIEG